MEKLVKETFQGSAQKSKEANQLIEQLSNGNMNPGIETNILEYGMFEARGRNGIRVYFRNVDGGIEILAYSDKSNQQSVIDLLYSIYR